MKPYLLLNFLLLQLISVAQQQPTARTDCNTIFICVDSSTYQQLYRSKYIKDSLFFCREQQQETNTDSYTGRYLMGESATIEFFQPEKTEQLGDHWGDWGIEFKTRQIHTLNGILTKAKLLQFAVDTVTTTTVLDSLPIPWYKTIRLKNAANELSILEYQPDYLRELGFTDSQINQPMTYKAYNSILSNGKKYPRQFSMITYIKLYADKKLVADLEKFATLNNCRKAGNRFTNGETTIEYIEVDQLPKFPLREIGVSLLNSQNYRIEKISENLYLKIKGKKASFIFKNNN